MIPIRRISMPVGLLAVAFCLGCASSDRVVRLYQNDSMETPFDSFLVVAVYADANARRDFEAAFVRELRAAGVTARYSLEFLQSTEQLDRNSIAEIARNSDIDAVLISRPVSIDRAGEFEQGRATATAERRQDLPIADFFRYHYEEYEDPMTLERVATVVIETDLYRTSDETRVWQVRSTAIDKTSVFEVVTDETRALAGALRKDGLLP